MRRPPHPSGAHLASLKLVSHSVHPFSRQSKACIRDKHPTGGAPSSRRRRIGEGAFGLKQYSCLNAVRCFHIPVACHQKCCRTSRSTCPGQGFQHSKPTIHINMIHMYLFQLYNWYYIYNIVYYTIYYCIYRILQDLYCIWGSKGAKKKTGTSTKTGNPQHVNPAGSHLSWGDTIRGHTSGHSYSTTSFIRVDPSGRNTWQSPSKIK